MQTREFQSPNIFCNGSVNIMEQQQNVLSGTKLIRKRDKRLKEYDISHIRNAVWAAYKELGLEKEFQEQIGHEFFLLGQSEVLQKKNKRKQTKTKSRVGIIPYSELRFI